MVIQLPGDTVSSPRQYFSVVCENQARCVKAKNEDDAKIIAFGSKNAFMQVCALGTHKKEAMLKHLESLFWERKTLSKENYLHNQRVIASIYY